MIYLDHHAATPTCEAARAAMHEAAAVTGNPASVHGAGQAARRLLELARDQVAAAVGASPADLIWTSGGTEACNLAIHGAAGSAAVAGERIVTTAVEHPAVAEAVTARARGAAVEALAVPAGRPPEPAALDQALAAGGASLVALQWINHETGTRFPVDGYARVCRERGVPLFVDATQALGKLPVDVEALGADLVAFSAHKCGGPAGVGALWARRGLDLSPLLRGGAQERGRRAGTPPLPAAVGFGAACATLEERLGAMAGLERLRTRFEGALVKLGAVINGDEGPRVPTASNASFEGRRGSTLVVALDLEGVSVSSGAACSSGLDQPSPVIAAMFDDQPWRAESALRFTFGPETTDTELDFAIEALARVLSRESASHT